MEIRRDNQSICFYTSPLLSQIATKFVQALYILQALAAEEDILLSKQLLDHGFHNIIRQKSSSIQI
jgi:hypothetical protein